MLWELLAKPIQEVVVAALDWTPVESEQAQMADLELSY
jgi:hypothetical protein